MLTSDEIIKTLSIRETAQAILEWEEYDPEDTDQQALASARLLVKEANALLARLYDRDRGQQAAG